MCFQIFIFVFNFLGLGIAQIKVAETEADLEIETKTEEREDVLLVRRRVIKQETVKKEAAAVEEGLDLDLILGQIEEGDTAAEETTLALILEIEEDLEEETLETEGQDHLNPETEDKLDLPETEEETIEAFQDRIPLSVKIAETDDHTGKMALKKETPPEEGLLVKEKEVKTEKLLKEKAFQEVTLKELKEIVKEDSKETALSNKCLKVKSEMARNSNFHKFLDLVLWLKNLATTVASLTKTGKKRKLKMFEQVFRKF